MPSGNEIPERVLRGFSEAARRPPRMPRATRSARSSRVVHARLAARIARTCASFRLRSASGRWAVADEHVYTDDGVSGAEFERRPGFERLISDLPKRGRPPFDVLVMSEPSRLGRDQQRNGFYLAHIRDSGVKIFYYLDDSEEKLDTPEQVLMSSVKSYASEVERIKAGQRSRDALQRRAARGFNAGGVVYGYDNVPVFTEGLGGEKVKSHTDYRINEAQADVIRRIFQAYAAGHGHVSIAKALNGDPRYADLSRRHFDGARPTPPRKGTGSWAPSSVRAMLCNERYTGLVTFGVHRKVYRHGTRARVRRPENEVQRTQREDLRIVPDALWREVRARFDAAKKVYLRDTHGKLWGRPGTGVESKYLLTGLGECGCCGHNITMIGGRSGSPGKRQPAYYYGCAYHHARGRTICTNDHHARMVEADALVIERVRSVLTPEVADEVIDEALEMLAQRKQSRADSPDRLDAEARRLRKEIDRFLSAIAGGKAPASVLAEIARREARLAEIGGERAALTVQAPSELEARRLRRSLRDRLAQFDELLLGDVPQARQALRKVIDSRIEFRPAERRGERGYHLRWSLVTSALVGGYIGMASPRGFEPRLPP